MWQCYFEASKKSAGKVKNLLKIQWLKDNYNNDLSRFGTDGGGGGVSVVLPWEETRVPKENPSVRPDEHKTSPVPSLGNRTQTT